MKKLYAINMTKYISMHFRRCKGLSNNDIEVAGGTVLQEIRPGAGVRTGYFVEEKLGGLP